MMINFNVIMRLLIKKNILQRMVEYHIFVVIKF